MTDEIEIVLGFKDSQQVLTMRGTVTHIQCDQLTDGFGKDYKRFQLFIKDIPDVDKFEKKVKKP